jgi:hypothetical protein
MMTEIYYKKGTESKPVHVAKLIIHDAFSGTNLWLEGITDDNVIFDIATLQHARGTRGNRNE